MEYLSLGALAKALKRDKGGLSRLAKKGTIPKRSDGKFDLEEVKAALKSKTDPARAKSTPSQPRQQPGQHPPIATKEDAEEAVSLIKQVLREEGRSETTVIDFDAARTADTILKARERWLGIQTDSRRLVDRDEVERAVFRLGREDRDALVNWPARVAPLMAAELGVDQVVLAVVLEKYVREHLADRGDAGLRLGGEQAGDRGVDEGEAA